jgi:hypothetical protein
MVLKCVAANPKSPFHAPADTAHTHALWLRGKMVLMNRKNAPNQQGTNTSQYHGPGDFGLAISRQSALRCDLGRAESSGTELDEK